MNEANNNAFSVDSESHIESISTSKNQIEDVQTASESSIESSHLLADNTVISEKQQLQNAKSVSSSESTEQKMNWQKVAHKLREYNRKLLKKVFRLEQDLAEIENKFNKQTEKSRSSDLLVAKQAEEIEAFQEVIADFERKIHQKSSSFQILIDQQETVIDNLSLQYELSQKQAAQIERECALLQENHNNKVYELTTKEQEIKDLKSKLSQQQRYTIQYKAELKRLKEQIKVREPIKTTPTSQDNSFNKLSIKPWSVAATPETKIALPKTKLPANISKQALNNSETVKAAAEIATWSASEVVRQEIVKSKDKVKSSPGKKPQSLAAVDLPTFPRPK